MGLGCARDLRPLPAQRLRVALLALHGELRWSPRQLSSCATPPLVAQMPQNGLPRCPPPPAPPPSLLCCLLRADTGYRERSKRCGDARGGRGNGERAYVTVCTPAPGACARHRQRVLRARTAVVRTPDMDANGLISIHQLEQLPLKHTDTTRAAPIGIPTSKPRYNPAQDVPHTPLPAPLPALLYRYGPFRRGSSVRRGTQGCVSREDAPVNS